MPKHTPGPWHLGQGNGEGSVFAKEGRMRLENGGTTLYPIASVVSGWSPAEDAANAALLAAAPDLLHAAQIAADLGARYKNHPHIDGLVGNALSEIQRFALRAIGKASIT